MTSLLSILCILYCQCRFQRHLQIRSIDTSADTTAHRQYPPMTPNLP